MRFRSETFALAAMHELKSSFAQMMRDQYEHRAKSCTTCDTQGACCLDAHFVNVRITRLEAVAIRRVIDRLSPEKRAQIDQRIRDAITKYDLDAGGETFACPLFEKSIGCLVHEYGKPLPCIAHACYEKKEDLPPDELLAEQEVLIADLNERVYNQPATLLPLPVAIDRRRFGL